MIYKLYHPDGLYMCDFEIRDNDTNFNKAQVNDPDNENFNPKFPKWIKTSNKQSEVLASSK